VTKVRIALGTLAAEVLTRNSDGGGETAPEALLRAIRLYLRDKGNGGPTWSYPAFLAARQRVGASVTELELSIDEGLWRDFENEAATQEVEPARLLEHAIFYYAAELDAGRVTARILAELDEEEDD
jgi:hypothetical protein